MVTLTLNTTLEEDVSNSLNYIGKLKDEGESLEEMIQTVEEVGYVVKIEYKNGGLTLTIEDS